MHRHLRFLLAACVAAGALGSAPAQADVPGAPLVVVHGWSRATPPGTTMGVAYFEIVNAGPADILIGIRSPLAQRVEMHSTTQVDGLMQMRMTGAVAVPAHAHLKFEPGGLHAMLVDLKAPLVAAGIMPLTLTFQRAGDVTVTARIEGLGADAPPAADAAPSGADFRLTPWPRVGGAPDFTLVDADGRPRALAHFRGAVLVVFFGFVHCPDVCPAELFKLAMAMKQMGPQSSRVQVVFITLDPARDTGRVLKNYVTAFDPRFLGLTGSSAQIDAAARRFHIEYARVPVGAGYTIDHSTSTFILDTAGRLRLVGGSKASAADFAHDLTVLAAE